MCGRHSIYYVRVTCCDIDVTKRLSEIAREKARGNDKGPSHVLSKRKEEIKSGNSATSTDRLQKISSEFQKRLRLRKAANQGLKEKSKIVKYTK